MGQHGDGEQQGVRPPTTLWQGPRRGSGVIPPKTPSSSARVSSWTDAAHRMGGRNWALGLGLVPFSCLMSSSEDLPSPPPPPAPAPSSRRADRGLIALLSGA